MRTVMCKCNDCGKNFESFFTMSTVCNDCTEVSVRGTKDGEEYYRNIPRYDAEAVKHIFKKEGYQHVYISDAIYE